MNQPVSNMPPRFRQVRDDYESARDHGLALVMVFPNGRVMLVEYVGPNYAFVSERSGYTEKIFASRLQREFDDDRFWATMSIDEVNTLPPNPEAAQLSQQMYKGGYMQASAPDAHEGRDWALGARAEEEDFHG